MVIGEQDAIDRLFVAWSRHRSASSSLLGLRVNDLEALRWVDSLGCVRPAELTRRLRMSSGGTSAVIDRLVGAGYVARLEGAAGSSGVDVVPTLAGRAAAEGQWTWFREEVERVTSAMADSERVVLGRGMIMIAEAAERHAVAAETAAADRLATASASRVQEPTVPWS